MLGIVGTSVKASTKTTQSSPVSRTKPSTGGNQSGHTKKSTVSTVAAPKSGLKKDPKGAKKSAPNIASSPSKSQSLPPVTNRGRALHLLSLPAQVEGGKCGHVRIRFNHYNKSFPIFNSVLKWEDVDNEYSFSFVYKGNYRRDLIRKGKNNDTKDDDGMGKKSLVLRDDAGDFFLDLLDGEELVVEIEEDAAAGIGGEGLRLRDEKLSAATLGQIKSGGGTLSSSGEKVGNSQHVPELLQKSKQVGDITRQLLEMKVEDLHNDNTRQLREARDIEDILYSGQG